MPDFELFVEKHHEHGAQALIENLERFKGVQANSIRPLKERWERVMGADAMRKAA